MDQVNTAVAQMDKVTQSNAATAEQSAAAAAELLRQSNNLNVMVDDLQSLVEGGNGRSVMRLDATAFDMEHDDGNGGVTGKSGKKYLALPMGHS